MERALRYDKLPLRVESGHKVAVDVVGALLVIGGLQLDAAVVVGQNVGEPVLGPVARQVGGRAGLVPPDMLELLVLLAEPEVAVGRHDAVVLSKVLQLDRP